ncbi:unnamed protein product [Amoebophrya sp. A25]|nr:unnamed protein product [Amoebophrya sp. A25]|eukprot:GSA25T00014076001.1
MDNGDNEAKTDFTGPQTGRVYRYQPGDGYAQGGGYVLVFDVAKVTEDELRRELQKLYYDGWFDLQMATFSVDFLLFNGNWRQFLQLGYNWRIPFSGLAKRTNIYFGVSLDLYNNTVPGVTVRIVLEILVYTILVLFVILEVNKARFVGVSLYFSKPSTWVSNAGLLLSWVVVIFQFARNASQPSFAYLFQEKTAAGAAVTTSALDDAKNMATDFKNFEVFATFAFMVQTLTAINLTVVFAKAVVLVSDLSPWLALISNVLSRAAPYLIYFTSMFFIIFCGFVLFGHFLFGQQILLLSNLLDATLFLFALLCGGSAVKTEDFTAADGILGPIYIVFFYVVMIFTLMNVFLSILLGSYDVEKFELERRIEAGTTTNAAEDASAMLKRVLIESILVPISDIVRSTRRAVFGPSADELELEGGTPQLDDETAEAAGGGGENASAAPVGSFLAASPVKGLDEETQADDSGTRPNSPTHSKSKLGRAASSGSSRGMSGLLVSQDEEKGAGRKFNPRLAWKTAITAAKEKAQKTRASFRKKKEVVAAYIESTGLKAYFGRQGGRRGKRRRGEEAVDDEGEGTRGGLAIITDDPNEEAQEEEPPADRMVIVSLLNLLLFVVLFVILMGLQVRGRESLLIGQANLADPLEAPNWVDAPPLRVVNFEDIQSMHDVFEWSKTALTRNLYAQSVCLPRSGVGAPRVINSRNVGALSADDALNIMCDPATEMEVNRVADSNSGFQYTTFVRLTIQQACYEANPDPTYESQYPYLRSNGIGQVCGTVSCSQNTCLDAHGVDNARPSYTGLSGTEYTFKDPEKLGTFGLSGGYQIYLGKNASTALTKLENLKTDLLFTELEVSSMVFDYVTQNSNMDLYVYTSVSFSQLETGELVKKAESIPLPLSVFDEGNYYASERSALFLMFLLYLICALIYLHQEIKTMLKQQAETFSEYRANPYGIPKPHIFQFLLDHYSKSPFNMLETASTISSLVILLFFALYLAHAFRASWSITANMNERFSIPNSEVKMWEMNRESSPDRLTDEDGYIFLQFEVLRSNYQTIVTVASINSLFLTLKVVKFVLGWRIFFSVASTLSKALPLIMVFTVVLTLQLVGFALLFHVEFGTGIPELGTPVRSVDTMFRFLLGDFDDTLKRMMDRGEAVTSIMFILFMLFFYFLLMQMYLATMMSTYSACASKETLAYAKEIVQTHGAQDDRKKLEEKRARSQERGRRKQARDVVMAEGDPQTTLLVARTLNCLQNLKKIMSGPGEGGASSSGGVMDGGGGELALGDKKGSEMGGKKGAEFWRANGGFAEVNRDVVDAVSRFEVESDVKTVIPRGYLSLSPEDQTGELKVLLSHLDSLVAMRNRAGAHAQEPMMSEEAKNDFYFRSLRTTIVESMFTKKGARLFQKDNTYFAQTLQLEDFADVGEMASFLAGHQVYGEELWLDALIVALESQDCTFVNRLFTSFNKHKMDDPSRMGVRVLEKLRRPLYEGGDRVLTLFELKAKAEYYTNLKEEAELRRTLCSVQNRILHEYASELQTFMKGHFAEHKRLEQKKLHLIGELRKMM